MKNILYILTCLLFLQSCYTDDDTIIEAIPIDLSVGIAELTEDYSYQVFYDLETNSTVSQNLTTDWDLGFECSDSGWHVILNSAKFMHAGNSRSTDFESVTSHEGLDMYFDPSNKFGNDSSAIGQWYENQEGTPVSKQMVYVIDRGNNFNNEHIGYKKVVLDFKDENTYEIRSANLDDTEEKTDEIAKDANVNFLCYSFENGVVEIEPSKETWCLQFTRYTTMLYSEGKPYPYILNGTLLNPYLTKSKTELDTINPFDEANYEFATSSLLSRQKDTIGYDWKTYLFDIGRFKIDTIKYYLIEDAMGDFYKLRFKDFYDTEGKKGYPTFEYLKL